MVAQMVQILPAMKETQVPSLHQEDLLEKGSVSGQKRWHLSHGTADSIGSGSLAFHFIKIPFFKNIYLVAACRIFN